LANQGMAKQEQSELMLKCTISESKTRHTNTTTKANQPLAGIGGK